MNKHEKHWTPLALWWWRIKFFKLHLIGVMHCKKVGRMAEFGWRHFFFHHILNNRNYNEYAHYYRKIEKT